MNKKISKLCTVLFVLGCSESFASKGNIEFSQTFYGNSGKYKTETAHPSIELNYNFNDNWGGTLGWDRTFNMYNYNGGQFEQNNNYSSPYGSITYSKNHLNGTKINTKTTVTLKDETTFNDPSQMYGMVQSIFDFAEYLPSGEYIKPTQFAISPIYIYGWNLGNPSGHQNSGALGFLSNWNLPNNFSFTLNAFLSKDWYNGAFTLSNDSGDKIDESVYFGVYGWLNYNKEICQFNQQTNLMFNFIGGFDPYIVSNKKSNYGMPYLYADQMYEWLSPTNQEGSYKNTYELFALPQLQLNYKYSDNTTISLFAQVKYSNQTYGETEKDWKLQPQGGVSVNYTF